MLRVSVKKVLLSARGYAAKNKKCLWILQKKNLNANVKDQTEYSTGKKKPKIEERDTLLPKKEMSDLSLHATDSRPVKQYNWRHNNHNIITVNPLNDNSDIESVSDHSNTFQSPKHLLSFTSFSSSS